MGYNIISLIGR